MLKRGTGDLQGKRPASPLIMAAWEATSALDKAHRLREHLEWAVDHDQLDEVGRFLRSLSDDEWSYLGSWRDNQCGNETIDTRRKSWLCITA